MSFHGQLMREEVEGTEWRPDESILNIVSPYSLYMLTGYSIIFNV